MGDFRRKLLTTTMIPAVVGLGSVMAFDAAASMCPREAAAKTYTMALENPDAAEEAVTGVAAGCGACGGGGCGAGGGCNPCAASCGACNPCAAECEEDPCNPCAVCEDPCGGCGASLETVTGVAAGCGACGGGCGAGGGGCGACGGCNPCAASCGSCNPCAAECEEDPCNPCAVCEDPCGGCGASLDHTGAGTWVAMDVLHGEPTVAYAAYGLLPHGDAPAELDHGSHLAANHAAQGFGVTGDGTAELGPRFVLEPEAVGNGSWRYTLSVT